MRSIAVVPRGFKPDAGRFAQVVHAVNVQVNKDFTPAWEISASLGYFARIEDAPHNSSFVIVATDVKGNGGMHFAPGVPDEPPHAIVAYDDAEDWSVLLSHEVLEMLVDPSCRYMVAGPDPENSSRKAQFLVEVCDPCMQITYKNQEAPGIRVSDFCLPAYYGLKGGGRYTHRNSIDAAFTVARGGYLTWENASGDWRQLDATGGGTSTSTIDPKDIAGAVAAGNFRGTLDRRHGNYVGASFKEQSNGSMAEQDADERHDLRRRASRMAALRDALGMLRL